MEAEKPKNNYVSNSFWMLLEKSARIISGILVGVLVVRYLGDAQFGTISYGLGIIGILTIFSTLGLDSLVVRELITRHKDQHKILGTAFGLRFMGSLAVVAGSCFYSLLRDPIETTYIVFLLSISIVFQSLSVIDFHFQSQVKGKYTAINQVITLFVSAIIKLWFIYVKAPLEWFATMAAFEAGLAGLNQIIFYKKDNQKIRLWRFSKPEAKHLLLLALPLIFSSFIQLLYQNVDSILIARFLRDMGKVGQYMAGVRISQASYFIPVAVCAAVFPGIVNNRNNPELQKKRLTQLYSLMIWGALIIIAGSMLLGDWVIGLLYGSKFPNAPEIFKIHIWVSLPVFWGTAWGMWMLAIHQQKYVLWMQILNAVLILSCEFILIPRVGITGAAYALVIGSYSALIFMVISYKPKEGLLLFIKALNPKNILEVIRYSKG
ncbi:MAG: flippase [Bacteroidia bacterium]|nr:flippase [Bacteroidia bacterium]MCF8425690.1 flippase [Bacteroidia bacterium]MCF8446016.1 flippase [Bacteroidia bacterium]